MKTEMEKEWKWIMFQSGVCQHQENDQMENAKYMFFWFSCNFIITQF